MRSDGRALIHYDSCPYKKREPYLGCVCPEKRPCEDTVKRHPSIKQGEMGQEKANFKHFDLELHTQNCEKINFCSFTYLSVAALAN